MFIWGGHIRFEYKAMDRSLSPSSSGTRFAGSVTGVHKNDVWVLGLGDLVPLPSIDMCNVIRSNSGFVYEC